MRPSTSTAVSASGTSSVADPERVGFGNDQKEHGARRRAGEQGEHDRVELAGCHQTGNRVEEADPCGAGKRRQQRENRSIARARRRAGHRRCRSPATETADAARCATGRSIGAAPCPPPWAGRPRTRRRFQPAPRRTAHPSNAGRSKSRRRPAARRGRPQPRRGSRPRACDAARRCPLTSPARADRREAPALSSRPAPRPRLPTLCQQ